MEGLAALLRLLPEPGRRCWAQQQHSPTQRGPAGAGCCLLVSAKCCVPPAKRLRMGPRRRARSLSGFQALQ